MNNLKNRFNFEEVAKVLKCTSSDVHHLVVVEKRLPAVYVTHVGYVEPYDSQMVKVDESGKVFDLCYGYENPPHIAYLWVDRDELEKFCGTATPANATNDEKELGTRERSAYLSLIGAMLELIKTPRSGRDSNTAVIDELIDNYSEIDGISKANLEKRFAEATRQLHSKL